MFDSVENLLKDVKDFMHDQGYSDDGLSVRDTYKEINDAVTSAHALRQRLEDTMSDLHESLQACGTHMEEINHKLGWLECVLETKATLGVKDWNDGDEKCSDRDSETEGENEDEKEEEEEEKETRAKETSSASSGDGRKKRKMRV